MAKQGALREALELSETLLTEIEMSTSTLSNVALKAGRVARLVGQFDQQQIMQYEASGYPSSPKGVSAETWRLARIAGRVYSKNVQGVNKEYAKLEPIEQAEAEIKVAMNLSPNAYPRERAESAELIKEKTKFIASRRAYVYDFISSVYYELKFSQVASDMFDRTRVKVDSKILEVIPDAVKRFSAVYENLLSENDEDWSNAVHSCRRILQDTADALYPARADKTVLNGKKEIVIKLGNDNYINRLIAYVEENSESKRFNEIVGSHMSYLGERLDSIFQAAQKGSHDVITSQDEADRYVIYTYLVIGDILQLKAKIGAGQKP